MTRQESKTGEQRAPDSKWMKLIFASAPPGWVGIIWDEDHPKIIASGEDEESTRLAARTSGYCNAVLIQIPPQPSADKESGYDGGLPR